MQRYIIIIKIIIFSYVFFLLLSCLQYVIVRFAPPPREGDGEQERFNFVFLLAARHSSNKFGSALARSVGSPSACPKFVIDWLYIHRTRYSRRCGLFQYDALPSISCPCIVGKVGSKAFNISLIHIKNKVTSVNFVS